MQNFVPQLTADNSFTFFSSEFDEAFHSQYGARQEAQMKFVEPTMISQKAQKPALRLLDICYGLGYNTAAALEAIWATNSNCYVEVVALELDPVVPTCAIAHNLLNHWPQPIVDLLAQLSTAHQVQTERCKITLLFGDARATIQSVNRSGFQADAIFLDPFSPPKCPQLWTVEFIKQVRECFYSDSILATYSCAAAVRTALMASGLNIGSTMPVGRRSPGTVASLLTTNLPMLSQQEQEHLLTRAAVPYRDPHLSDSCETILYRRQQEHSASTLKPTSQWRKLWGAT